MMLSAFKTFETMLLEKAHIREAWFSDHIPKLMKDVPYLNEAKRMYKWLDMDNIYFQFAD